MDGYLLENGTDKFLLEDASGVLLLESGATADPLKGMFLLLEDIGK